MKKVSRLEYAYAVGRVRALEKNLISRDVFLEAAEEKDLTSSLKVIFDAGSFLETKLEIDSAEKLDSFLDREAVDLRGTVAELLLEDQVLTVVDREDSPSEALAAAEILGYDFFIQYLRRKIDLGNLKVFLRSKYMEIPKERFVPLMRSGGNIDPGKFVDNYEQPFRDFGENIRSTSVLHVWRSAVDAILEKETFVDMERELENDLMRFLRKAKEIVFGPEPVFAYALARKKELSLVRMLGVSKIDFIPDDILKSRMSLTYV
jgi:vacuolar-type H+-ATPase subunit C/Vma6